MVTCRYVGQTGNHLFTAAAAMAVAIRNNDEFLSPHQTQSKVLWKFYLTHLPKYNNRPAIRRVYNEQIFGYYGRIPYTKDMCLSGYYQSYLHFWDVKDKVLSGLKFPHWSNEPLDYTAIHVRRGDYVSLSHKHPPVSIEYLVKAMGCYHENEEFMFFSDDIEWCKDHFGTELNIEFSEGKSAIEDMELISRAKNVIISNSTFSYWGAMFNKQGGQVITPHKDNWFGPGNKHLSTEHLLPPHWKQIKY
ncbi:MAG TPA: hypothetical protein DCF44_06920 [Chitinophagaceae bacterium]|nr:hypothetical protein [Chitinophagaceae bacterium]